MHHHRFLFNKYHPCHFGKVGMRYFHKLRNKFYSPIMNIDKLASLIPQEVKDKAIKEKKVPVIDVAQHGYFKILGKGVFPQNQPFMVKTKPISKIAEKKIKEVRSFTDLGLKEAKELVEKFLCVLKKGITKDEANPIVEKLKELGASVVLE